MLSQFAFGTSERELRLLALAIKYGGFAGKTIVITSGKG
jgi:hypothetical protein